MLPTRWSRPACRRDCSRRPRTCPASRRRGRSKRRARRVPERPRRPWPPETPVDPEDPARPSRLADPAVRECPDHPSSLVVPAALVRLWRPADRVAPARPWLLADPPIVKTASTAIIAIQSRIGVSSRNVGEKRSHRPRGVSILQLRCRSGADLPRQQSARNRRDPCEAILLSRPCDHLRHIGPMRGQ